MLGQYRTTIGDEPVSLSSFMKSNISNMNIVESIAEKQLWRNSITWGSFYTDYLQLPDELPERVGELAAEITESSQSVYDKTKAIERYFDKNELLQSKKCRGSNRRPRIMSINFCFIQSSVIPIIFPPSMVVMLRTIGIPAK